MTETKPLDEIIQRLDALSLEQLLEARTKIDSLIQSKYTLMKSKDLLNTENIRKDNIPVSLYRDVCRDILAKLEKITDSAYTISKISNDPSVNYSLSFIDQSSLPETEDNSLKDVIELVNGWMADESGYDEETYPQIEAGLNHNRLSL
ncbi:hypothetical protein [Coleofasciculus sp.]|uniref:hypothetical protein n=1 Tax=Coleofasciculus sp. TaxID=3100458 RepID=UPI0039FB634A